MTNSKTIFIFNLLFVLITFLGLNLLIYAQAAKIEHEEFTMAHRKAFEQLKGKPQRIIFKSVTRLERAIHTFESVNEIVPPDKKRFYTNHNAEPKNSSAEFIMEIIEIGQKRFSRRDNGVWTETSITPEPINRIQTHKPQTEKTLDHYFLGETTFEGKAADLYEVIIRDRLKTKQPSGEDTETLVLMKTRYWFGKNGLWIRDESEYDFSDAVNNKVTHRQQMTRTYEYAPNLKIETPKIN